MPHRGPGLLKQEPGPSFKCPGSGCGPERYCATAWPVLVPCPLLGLPPSLPPTLSRIYSSPLNRGRKSEVQAASRSSGGTFDSNTPRLAAARTEASLPHLVFLSLFSPAPVIGWQGTRANRRSSPPPRGLRRWARETASMAAATAAAARRLLSAPVPGAAWPRLAQGLSRHLRQP